MADAYRPVSALPAENVPLDIAVGDGRVFRGWMSLRFLNGTPTWWTITRGRTRLLSRPYAWRYSANGGRP